MQVAMRRLVLLVGLHKTGTTSIQRTCAANLPLIKSAGFLYPTFGKKLPDGSVRHDENQSALLSRMFRKKTPGIFSGSDFQQQARLFEAEKGSLRSSLRKSLRASSADALFVAEECSRLAPDELLDLKGYFGDLGFEIQVFCCIRKPGSWLASMVAQAIAGGRSIRTTIPEIIRLYGSSAGIVVPSIQNVMQAFPAAQLYSFDAAVAHNAGPVGFFFDKAGIDLGEGLKVIRANEGRSDHAVRLNEKINESVGRRFLTRQNDVFYATLYSRYPALLDIPGNKFSLRESEVAPLLSMLARENEWLKEHFGEGFHDEEIGFGNESVSLEPKTRSFLIDNFGSAEQPVKGVVEKYLAEH
jgi:hypothetical protein